MFFGVQALVTIKPCINCKISKNILVIQNNTQKLWKICVIEEFFVILHRQFDGIATCREQLKIINCRKLK